ncbi:MAG: stage V sporulation protein AB [Bacillota bacterium]
MKEALAGLVAMAEGLATGAGLVALLSLLDIVPRLARLTGTPHRVRTYETSIMLGALLASLADTLDLSMRMPEVTMVAVGLFTGVSVGLLTAAVAEVLNVLPVVGRRLGVEDSMPYLVGALLAGKTLGSLFQWVFPGIR